MGVTKPAIRRLARRGGIKRIAGITYEETRGNLKANLEAVLGDATTVASSRNRHNKTYTFADIQYALKRQGRTLYT